MPRNLAVCAKDGDVPLNPDRDCSNILLDRQDVIANAVSSSSTIEFDGLEIGLLLTIMWLAEECIPLSYNGDTDHPLAEQLTPQLIDQVITKLIG